MAEQIETSSPEAPFVYELYEGDPDHLRTVDATPPLPNSYIDPASLKLKYRIGHGLFGDVWVATHHQSGSDFDEHHEVAVKMLHPIQEDCITEFLHKFEEVWVKSKSQQLDGVSWLHGISVLSGQISIAMKFYEGSIGDRIGCLKGGKLQLADVLRYGIGLAKGIRKLHQIGLLILNLKPTNFLIDESDHVVLGDFGIPYLLLGIPWRDSHLEIRSGTPNYIAPEQWQPGVIGPISYETDSWGFACSMIEMLTGTPPWFGRCADAIHHAVVIRKEKPQLPSGLPPAVQDVLKGCLEYDFRNRPLMSDIIQAFESSQSALHNDGSWSSQGSNLYAEKSYYGGYSKWFPFKDHLQVGDSVRPKNILNTCKPQPMGKTEGVVIGLENDCDQDGFALVQIPGRHNQIRVNISALQRVTSGFASGDWVHLIKESREHSALGILHTVQRDGSVTVGFLGRETLWMGHTFELKVVDPFLVGQFVRLRANVSTPQFEWPHKRGGSWASGKITQILPNGCLEVAFPGRFILGDECACFLANPGEVERVSFDTCPGIVEKYQHVEDFHWAVRPVAIALGIFTATKLGIFVGRNVGARLQKNKAIHKGNKQEGQNSGNSAWLPPNVANILFKEGPEISNSA